MDGVLQIDKPAGISSHDAVAAVRRALGGVRTGHAGTLDPFATGLLLVLVGRATKSQRAFMALPKRYRTVARLGALSSTGDPEGEITETGRLPHDPPSLPTGEIRQRPPMHSAVKVGGERAYRRARRGESFQIPERIAKSASNGITISSWTPSEAISSALRSSVVSSFGVCCGATTDTG